MRSGEKDMKHDGDRHENDDSEDDTDFVMMAEHEEQPKHIEKLHGKGNWSTWSRNIKFLLGSRDLDEYAYSKPPNDVFGLAWIRKAQKAGGLIGMNIDTHIQDEIPGIGDMHAAAILNALSAKLRIKNDGAKRLEMQQGETIGQWAARVDNAAIASKNFGQDLTGGSAAVILYKVLPELELIQTYLIKNLPKPE